ncbi:MAG: DUF4382 domain-containing protein [Ferruginibacter sp.]
MKKNTRAFLLLALLLPILILFFNACQKETSGLQSAPEGQSRMNIYISDGPTDYEHVYLDIQSIAVKIDTCSRNRHDDDDDHHENGCDDDHDQMNSHCDYWDTLNINPGVYDLMTLRNGVDTLLASDFVLNGHVKRIKFTLGTNNSVVADSVSHPLQLLNNQNWVYVDIQRRHLDSLSSSNFNLYLDIDLDRSIRYRNGSYWLKPVIKPFGRNSTGEIEGKIRPVHSYWLVKAYNATDTGYAIPWSNGEFKIRGLQPGSYSVFIDGRNGYADTTITNVEVERREDTELGTITLHQ